MQNDINLSTEHRFAKRLQIPSVTSIFHVDDEMNQQGLQPSGGQTLTNRIPARQITIVAHDQDNEAS